MGENDKNIGTSTFFLLSVYRSGNTCTTVLVSGLHGDTTAVELYGPLLILFFNRDSQMEADLVYRL